MIGEVSWEIKRKRFWALSVLSSLGWTVSWFGLVWRPALLSLTPHSFVRVYVPPWRAWLIGRRCVLHDWLAKTWRVVHLQFSPGSYCLLISFLSSIVPCTRTRTVHVMYVYKDINEFWGFTSFVFTSCLNCTHELCLMDSYGCMPVRQQDSVCLVPTSGWILKRVVIVINGFLKVFSGYGASYCKYLRAKNVTFWQAY